MVATEYNLSADNPPDGFDEEKALAKAKGEEIVDNPPDLDENGNVVDPRAAPLGHVKGMTPMERLTGLVAAGSVGTSIATMVLVGGSMVMVAGILALICGPYAYYQQTRLTDIAALKETHAALEREVNFLAAENTRLAQNVERLAGAVDRLADVETALDVMTQTMGQSVDSFMEQVEENKGILKSMDKNLKASVLQNLLSVVMGSDTDGDFILDADEVDALILNLHSINGCQVNEQKLRQMIREKHGAMDTIVDVIRDVINEGGDNPDAIFSFPDEN